MLLKDLREKRAKLLADARAAHEANNAEDFTRLEGEIAEIDGKIDRQAKIDDFERRQTNGTVISGTDDQQLDAEIRRFSLLRAIGGAAGLNIDWGRERELQGELARRAGRPAQGILIPMEVFHRRVTEQRTQTVGSDPAGGYLVSTDHRGDLFIDTLRNKLITGKLGARTLAGLVGDQAIPKRTGSVSTAWVGENESIDLSDATFGQTNMYPRHVGTRTEISRQTVLQSNPDIEQLTRDDMAAQLAEAVDLAAIAGTGTKQPTGILNHSEVTATPWTTDYITTSADMIAALDTANANPMRSFLTTPGVRGNAMKIKNSDALPIKIAEHFHDEPVAFSNLVPTNLGGGSNEHGILYGDWTDLLIGYWSAFDLLVNPYESSAYAKGNIQVRAMLTCDVAIRHGASFTYTSKVIS